MQPVKKLFDAPFLVWLSASMACLYKFFFPDRRYQFAALAVLGVMFLDIITKLYALSKQSGGLHAAIVAKRIRSASFVKGTLDKMIVFIVMVIVCGLAYHLTFVNEIAVWFTQAVFTLLFFRDVISVFENLTDAGIGGLGIFKRILKSKISKYTEEQIDEQPK